MRTQNLLDNDFARAHQFFHRRGWANRWRWELSWDKNPLKNFARFMLTLGGEDPSQVQLSAALFGVALYLTVHKVLPERWEIGWYKRGEVRNPRWDVDSHGRCWGFYFFEKTFVFQWNHTVIAGGSDRKKYGISKHFYFPWDWGSAVSWEVQREDGSWTARGNEYEPPYSDGRKVYTEPYTYKLKSGEIQNRVATFHVRRMEWRWRMFRRLRIGPKILTQAIDVAFDGEVGEQTGSWKGGTVGCSYEMNRGETPVQTLRRMEAERRFR